MGRPSKLTKRAQGRVVEAIAAGNYRETAARAAGVDPTTFYRWMDRGQRAEEDLQRFGLMTRRQLLREARDRRVKKVPARATKAKIVAILDAPEVPFRQFRHVVEAALVEREMADMKTITDAATKGEWRAAAWRLERMFPERYAPVRRMEVTGAGGGPVSLASEALNPHEALEAGRDRLRLLAGGA